MPIARDGVLEDWPRPRGLASTSRTARGQNFVALASTMLSSNTSLPIAGYLTEELKNIRQLNTLTFKCASMTINKQQQQSYSISCVNQLLNCSVAESTTDGQSTRLVQLSNRLTYELSGKIVNIKLKINALWSFILNIIIGQFNG